MPTRRGGSGAVDARVGADKLLGLMALIYVEQMDRAAGEKLGLQGKIDRRSLTHRPVYLL